jgi:hypothetical protein
MQRSIYGNFSVELRMIIAGNVSVALRMIIALDFPKLLFQVFFTT